MRHVAHLNASAHVRQERLQRHHVRARRGIAACRRARASDALADRAACGSGGMFVHLPIRLRVAHDARGGEEPAPRRAARAPRPTASDDRCRRHRAIRSRAARTPAAATARASHRESRSLPLRRTYPLPPAREASRESAGQWPHQPPPRATTPTSARSHARHRCRQNRRPAARIAHQHDPRLGRVARSIGCSARLRSRFEMEARGCGPSRVAATVVADAIVRGGRLSCERAIVARPTARASDASVAIARGVDLPRRDEWAGVVRSWGGVIGRASATMIVADLRTPAGRPRRGRPARVTASAAASRNGRSAALPRSFRSKGRSVMSDSTFRVASLASSPRRIVSTSTATGETGVNPGDCRFAGIQRDARASQRERGRRQRSRSCAACVADRRRCA